MSQQRSGKRARRSRVKNETTKVSKSQVEFNDLNDDCFKQIFDEFALQELIKLRGVCSKWKEIISNGICAPKKSLHLIVMHRNKNPPSHPEMSLKLLDIGKTPNVLKIFNISKNPGMKVFLKKLFPNIENLLFTKRQFTINDGRFIDIWSHQLASFTLMFKEVSSRGEKTLFKSLNVSTKLRNLNILTFNFVGKLDWSQLAPTLARLESFSIDTRAIHKNVDVMSLLGTECRRFGLSSDPWLHQYIVPQLKRQHPSDLIRNLTHLTLFNLSDFRLVKLACQHFINLKCLTARALPFDPKHIFDQKLPWVLPLELANAKHLEELTFFNIDLRFDYKFERVAKNVTSVKALTLTATQKFKESKYPEDWCKHLAAIFPKLERLSVKYTSHKQPNPMFKEELDSNRRFFKNLKSFTAF